MSQHFSIIKRLDDTRVLVVYPDQTGEYPLLWRIVWSDEDGCGESAERPAVSVDDAVEKAYELLLFWDTLM